MTDDDKWREWRKGEPGKLGWQEISIEPPKGKTDEEVWHEQWVAAGGGVAIQPGAAIEVPRGFLEETEPWWRRRPDVLVILLVILLLGGVASGVLLRVIAKGEVRRSQGRAESHLAPTIDLCATRLLLTQGRLLKTQGEVLYWLETRDGGMDLYLVKEIGDGSPLECGMKAHLPPTIPETTWRPTAGDRVTLCGLMLAAEHQARMGAAWRCM